MINELTKEQEAMIPIIRDEWLAHGLSTSPADRAQAETGVKLAYEAAGLKPPMTIIWAQSPVHGGYLKAAINDSDMDVSVPLTPEQVETALDLAARAVLGEIKLQYDSCSAFGAHDAGYSSFYDFWGRACALACVDRLKGLLMLNKSAGWWWAYETVCVISERHNVLHRDEQGRLHCPDGPAVAYPDGWPVYAWHGVRVQANVILKPQELEPIKVLQEVNAEVRRVMIERLGMERIAKETGAQVIAKDEKGELLRIELTGDEPLLMVHVICPSTQREYYLRVPPTMTTAKEAVAWTFGLTADQYNPRVET